VPTDPGSHVEESKPLVKKRVHVGGHVLDLRSLVNRADAADADPDRAGELVRQQHAAQREEAAAGLASAARKTLVWGGLCLLGGVGLFVVSHIAFVVYWTEVKTTGDSSFERYLLFVIAGCCVVAGFWLLRAAYSVRRPTSLFSNGIAMRAILQDSTLLFGVGDCERVRFRLEVQPAGGEPYEVLHREYLPGDVSFDDLAEGTELKVYVDRRRPRRLIIDWPEDT
jgi:hypothetical protein